MSLGHLYLDTFDTLLQKANEIRLINLKQTKILSSVRWLTGSWVCVPALRMKTADRGNHSLLEGGLLSPPKFFENRFHLFT